MFDALVQRACSGTARVAGRGNVEAKKTRRLWSAASSGREWVVGVAVAGGGGEGGEGGGGDEEADDSNIGKIKQCEK